jgi:hypothetical protein
MGETAKFKVSIAARGVKILCQNPPNGLTEEQLAALHLCKHEVIAAIYRLYMTVPQHIADAIIAPYFQGLPGDIDE